MLQKEHPDVVETLATPNWYFDRKGEMSEGEEPYFRSSIIYLENDPNGSPRVFARFDPNNLTSLARYVGWTARLLVVIKTLTDHLRLGLTPDPTPRFHRCPTRRSMRCKFGRTRAQGFLCI